MKPFRLPETIRRFLACESGTALVELGVVAVLATASVVGLVEFAAVTSQSIKLSNAARAAAEYAIDHPEDFTGISKVAASSGDLDAATLTVSVDQFCECPGAGTAGCADICASGAQSNKYVTVSLSQPAESYVDVGGFLDGVTLDHAATMRIR